MRSAFSQLRGGLVIIAVASLLGVVVNAIRSGGVDLIQKGAPVSTVRHGADTTAADTTGPREGIVSLAEMRRIFDEGSAFIIDARDPEEFAEGHIPGAINVPYDRLPEYLDMLNAEVPTDARVIIYCRGPACDFSDQLATELKILGYQDVSVFSGGWEHWTEAGYPVEGMVPK
jgi:rhodanese-related sulfurtransferase